jgi:hypothetical protein
MHDAYYAHRIKHYPDRAKRRPTESYKYGAEIYGVFSGHVLIFCLNISPAACATPMETGHQQLNTLDKTRIVECSRD